MMKKYNRPVLYLAMIFFVFAAMLSASTIKPTARFAFQKNAYQQREPIEIIDSSQSPDGKRITQREWMTVINKKKKTSSNINTLLKDVPPGSYEVFLRVKNQGGIWSEWTSRKVQITKSKAIEVNTFKIEKPLYAIGEKLTFIYQYDNPNELKIKSQKWTYRNLAGGSKIAGKPKYFMRPGKYEISMQIQDEWGNWSKVKTCTLQVNTEKIERNGYYLFVKGRQGDLLEGYIDKDYNTLETLKNVEVLDKPGTLIVSNSPERVSTSGVLYKDTVEGSGKLLVHHQNAAPVGKKLVVVATAGGNKEVNLAVSNNTIKGPSKNILGTGQAALRDYFKGSGVRNYVLKPGVPTAIYDSGSVRMWKREEVVSGMLDYVSDGSVTFTVAMLDHQSPLGNINQLSPLKKDIHIRGTFSVIEKCYTVDTTQMTEPSKLVIGSTEGEWVTGKDALTGETVRNVGNYGVAVYIHVKNKENMGIILNARGGAYQGAIKWRNGVVFDSPREEVLSSKTIATLVGMIKANESNEFVYMLPNGSAAPVLFGFIPERYWK